jgi:hypothetical protein
VLGYIVLLLGSISMLKLAYHLNRSLFWVAIVIDSITLLGYTALKSFRPRMQRSNSAPQNTKGVPIIKSSRDLAKYHHNYFIFADRVYSLDRIISTHPGGYEVIKHIRERVVDRFIYGSEPLATLKSMKVHSHTAMCMAMAGEPIGVLFSIVPYLNMQESN